MKKSNQSVSLIALMLLVFQLMMPTLMAQPIPTSNGPIGSILSVSDSGQIKYWNNTAWIAVSPGLPGQSLRFVNGIPTWINNPNIVLDFDGNVYDTIHIGTQIWMKQNLKVTHYRNGDAIPNVSDGTWPSLTTGAYNNYNNDANNAITYGRLYNYYTIEDARNLCPNGWHVSTTDEWMTLTTYLGGQDIAGIKLKEVGTAHWGGNAGATNESNFTALPGGFSFYNGGYGYLGQYGTWWSTPETSPTTASYWYIDGVPTFAYVASDSKNYGFSARCVKD